MLESLTADDFRPAQGATYRVISEGKEAIEIALVDVSEGEVVPGGLRRSFSLEFEHRTGGQPLAQGTHRLEREGSESLEIFLVPVGPHAASGMMRYEAIFT
jgi:hypothetical protein